VQWNGSGQALDVAKAPGRIGWQLHMNSKASLLHFQEQTMLQKRAGQWPMARGFFYSLAAIQGTPTKTQTQFACVHNWGRKEGCERAEKEALSGN